MTGIELIAKERQEQIEKHGRTIEDDVENNKHDQLIDGAIGLLITISFGPPESYSDLEPIGWNSGIWNRMCEKPAKEKLIIAGALIAAEIDRIQKLENT